MKEFYSNEPHEPQPLKFALCMVWQVRSTTIFYKHFPHPDFCFWSLSFVHSLPLLLSRVTQTSSTVTRHTITVQLIISINKYFFFIFCGLKMISTRAQKMESVSINLLMAPKIELTFSGNIINASRDCIACVTHPRLTSKCLR